MKTIYFGKPDRPVIAATILDGEIVLDKCISATSMKGPLFMLPLYTVINTDSDLPNFAEYERIVAYHEEDHCVSKYMVTGRFNAEHKTLVTTKERMNQFIEGGGFVHLSGRGGYDILVHPVADPLRKGDALVVCDVLDLMGYKPRKRIGQRHSYRMADNYASVREGRWGDGTRVVYPTLQQPQDIVTTINNVTRQIVGGVERMEQTLGELMPAYVITTEHTDGVVIYERFRDVPVLMIANVVTGMLLFYVYGSFYRTERYEKSPSTVALNEIKEIHRAWVTHGTKSNKG